MEIMQMTTRRQQIISTNLRMKLIWPLKCKQGIASLIGHSRGGASTKIHAVVDAYGYPVYLRLSEGQRNDINMAIPLLEPISLNGSQVLADRGYDSNQLIDYIYDHGGEPTIPSRKGARFERHCDWWLYKERHLVECFFLKLKAYRRIATRYDKLASTYLGFICIASILIWLKWLRIYNFQTHSRRNFTWWRKN